MAHHHINAKGRAAASIMDRCSKNDDVGESDMAEAERDVRLTVQGSKHVGILLADEPVSGTCCILLANRPRISLISTKRS